ncbi:MAG: 3-phosphoshikimate 1-carboxyvinyltransferase [Phycisphaerales bacterium]|nr:MAG: 3-phosphoshikimate 1-carboxyvinyltransferase [Phycisphaerales bacterium]
MSERAITPLSSPLDANVRIPGSKSLTNRALLVAGLAHGTSRLNNLLLADDTQYMVDALRSLGVPVQVDVDGNRAIVQGYGGYLPHGEADIYCGNAGTVMRFLMAACATATGTYRLDGSARMRERPIGELGRALQRLGALVQYEQAEGHPPLKVMARGLAGGEVLLRSPESSQMVSGLLMAGPAARNDVLIAVEGDLVSKPYVGMTLAVMEAFGVDAVEDRMRRFIVPAPQTYRAREYDIEPDASNASYFLAAAGIVGGRVAVEGLGRESVQGDARFPEVLERMGCRVEHSGGAVTVHGPAPGSRLRAVDVDLNDMPDLAQTVAVMALFAEGTTHIRNVANLRVKETDRVAALATELAKLGAEVAEHADGLTVVPPDEVRSAAIDTYDDHRMAMSFALVGLRVSGLVIRNADCVAKTFPRFFETLEHLGKTGASP